jgi:hypothetical protein
MTAMASSLSAPAPGSDIGGRVASAGLDRDRRDPSGFVVEWILNPGADDGSDASAMAGGIPWASR